MAPADSIAALVGEWKGNNDLVRTAATAVMAVVGKRSELTRLGQDHLMAENTEDFPGEPWEHHLAKHRPHGYKCLKCSLVGKEVDEIRKQQCKISKPQPVAPVPATSSGPTSSASVVGASAAVVGVELAKLGLATLADAEKERVALEKVERELAQKIEAQEWYALQLELEEAELEAQELELELYETEEQQLERAIKESLEENGVTPAAELSKVAASEMPPPAPKRKRLRLLRDIPEPVENPSKMSKTNEPHDVELPSLSRAETKLYQAYWARFVATPQNGHRQSHGPCANPASAVSS
eukprot:Skav210088  [mRNA]  locus=scaffold1510:249316:251576:- [translate_table: standard]